MGFFSRPKKAAVPAPHATQTSSVVQANHPSFTSPPPYHTSYTSPEPYAAQQATTSDPYMYQDDFISVEDFNTIQGLVDQDLIGDQFSNIISNIDEDRWNENDDDYSIIIPTGPPALESHLQETSRAIAPIRSRERRGYGQSREQKITIWSKVSYYENSNLIQDIPLLRVYIPTWPLICLAAQYSASAYIAPASSREREAFVSADPRLGTKAMVMKSVPCDDKKTLVFAIRGTSTLSLRDWNVNLRTAPVSPAGFLDDEGNLCHEGFLRVAKAMIKPIALRLRTLLEENPSRASCSLLITGHSAGGAVAALLFSHMLSTQESELSILTDCFKRVHCVTFGAPPVSLLPLRKPQGKRFQKSLFFSFMNEGDPVVRADKPYIKSLIDLLSTPLPSTAQPNAQKTTMGKRSFALLHQSMSKLDLTLPKPGIPNVRDLPARPSNTFNYLSSRANASQPNITFKVPQKSRSARRRVHYWPIPVATLSNAGRLVVMRVPHQPTTRARKGTSPYPCASSQWERDNLSKVTVHTVSDEQLRQVIFGNPTMHAMEVYLRRVDMLALKAVTARG